MASAAAKEDPTRISLLGYISSHAYLNIHSLLCIREQEEGAGEEPYRQLVDKVRTSHVHPLFSLYTLSTALHED